MKRTTTALAATVAAGLLAAGPAMGSTGAPQNQNHETEFGVSSTGSVSVFDGDGIRKVVHRNHKNGKKFVEYPSKACKKSMIGLHKHFQKLNTEPAVAVDCDGNRVKFTFS